MKRVLVNTVILISELLLFNLNVKCINMGCMGFLETFFFRKPIYFF